MRSWSRLCPRLCFTLGFVVLAACGSPPQPGDAGDARGDTSRVDMGMPDRGVPDMGRPDMGMPDEGLPDEGMPDEGLPDGEMPDGMKMPDAGMCPPGQTDCAGRCVDTNTDNNNCGSCGNVCSAGQTCRSGTCAAPCPPGRMDCGGTCVDTNTDNNNCGRCGNVCPAGQACMGGTCTSTVMCPPGQMSCGGVCVDTSTDPMNCGRCGNACPAGQTCSGGMCTMCPAGQTSCSGRCVDTNTDPMNCGGCGRACAPGQTCMSGMCSTTVMCPPGQTNCSGVCVDTNTDNNNCGMCGRMCSTGQVCRSGACTMVLICPPGQTNCMGTCRDLNTDRNNCGACGNVCPAGQNCVMGACVCPTGQTNCGGTCVNTSTDPMNCGRCGNVCTGGTMCSSGMCVCPTGQTNCSGTCVNTSTDPMNCGRCGNVCTGGTMCSSGMCVCPTGQTNCSGTCVDLNTDRNNCGMCGNACTGGRICSGGRCVCPTGQTLCGTTCVDLNTDPNNCGMCGRMCAAGQVCMGGGCTGGTPPPNDTRAGATRIDLTQSAVTLTTNTAAARNDTTGPCGCTSGRDVFYTFTLTRAEIVYADTVGTSWDTSLFLQDSRGNNITNANLPGGEACNDDNGLGCSTGVQSMIAARLGPGTYYLVLSGCNYGAATIHFQHLPVGSGEVRRINPGAMTQTLMAAPPTGTGTITSACCSGGPENTYWWPTCPGFAGSPFSASTCGGASWDTELDQRSAARTPVSVCNDDSCGLQSIVNSTIPPGPGLHALYLDTCGGTVGAATITFTMGTCPAGQTLCGRCVNLQTDNNNCGRCGNVCSAGQFCNMGMCVTPPPNDTRAGATTIDLTSPSVLLRGDTTNARNDTTGTCACTSGPDVFFQFTLTRAEIIYADTVGASWDTSLFLQDSTGANLVAAGIPNGQVCNDDNGLSGCSTGVASQILARLGPGTYYLVLSGCGRGVTTIRFQHLPVGNGAVSFVPAGAGQVLMGTTSGVGTVTSSCRSAGPEDTYFWYTCPSFAGGMFSASTCGRATWNTELDQRSAGRTPTSVCNDDAGGACGLRSIVTSMIPAGPGLHVLYVDGAFAASSGAYSVLVTRP